MSGTRRRRGSSGDVEKSSTVNSKADGVDNKENKGHNRTHEFQSTMKTLQGQGRTPRSAQHSNKMTLANHRVNQNFEQYSEFVKVTK